ncbi:hypothetical protein [Oligoflexus tunisiensis]|uniref:hypothetical protein n=1 Tax=Oligoflexus tunisiensis TaxID=708132 RepID=UPI00114CC895|nr:hypothetical protein [Oligoflexus tunisiensis]
MNLGLGLLLLHFLVVSCASTPKPVAKKKVGAGAVAPKAAKGKMPRRAPVKAAPPPAPVEEEEEEEEEVDDQFSRVKKYYKK